MVTLQEALVAERTRDGGRSGQRNKAAELAVLYWKLWLIV